MRAHAKILHGSSLFRCTRFNVGNMEVFLCRITERGDETTKSLGMGNNNIQAPGGDMSVGGGVVQVGVISVTSLKVGGTL